MKDAKQKMLVGFATVVAVVVGFVSAAGATATDPISDAIEQTESNVLTYAGMAVAAVIAVVMVAIGIRILPKVIRAIAARVTG